MAKSFPESACATTVSLIFSGLGLLAFLYLTVVNILFPGDTLAFLLLLALTTSISALVALFIVQPIPLPPTALSLRDDETIDHEQISRAFFAGPDIETPGYESSSVLEVGDSSPDIHGKMLWGTPDFYLICTIMLLFSCLIGSQNINNIGSISLALFADSNPNYDEVEASKWQAMQVLTLSIGLLSDLICNQLHLPRAYCLCIVSSLFIVSQAVSIEISSICTLWIATTLLGVAYSGLFRALLTIVIDWFGLGKAAERLRCKWKIIPDAPTTTISQPSSTPLDTATSSQTEHQGDAVPDSNISAGESESFSEIMDDKGWAEMTGKISLRSLDEELELYDLIDLDAEGDDDEQEFDNMMSSTVCGNDAAITTVDVSASAGFLVIQWHATSTLNTEVQCTVGHKSNDIQLSM
ncbi:hypothetical protein EDC04DRAFT_3093830 [Pisolithus marmoratus]|nr:hypothetical protein EDC04DRAFT_3093830 [Pisolithus marmoratus]